MPVKKIKKKVAAKTSEIPKQQPSEDLKKDIEQYTVPAVEENATNNSSENIAAPSSSFLRDSSDENVFWQTKRGKIWMSLFGLSIVLAFVVGLFMYRGGTTNSAPLPAVEAIPTKESQISPTPIPELLDLSKYKIEVLNGSGIPGEAAKVKVFLEEEKFTVASIGNADRIDYQKTIIQAKKTVPKEFLEKLKAFLEQSYVLSDTAESSEAGEVDVVIIVGTEKISQ